MITQWKENIKQDDLEARNGGIYLSPQRCGRLKQESHIKFGLSNLISQQDPFAKFKNEKGRSRVVSQCKGPEFNLSTRDKTKQSTENCGSNNKNWLPVFPFKKKQETFHIQDCPNFSGKFFLIECYYQAKEREK